MDLDIEMDDAVSDWSEVPAFDVGSEEFEYIDGPNDEEPELYDIPV